MTYLLDTMLVLWTVESPHLRPPAADAIIENRGNELWFSVINIWEIAIKAALPRYKMQAIPSEIRRQLLRHGYRELQISGEHAIAAGALPLLHRDPFDRMLIAQATVEKIPLLTTDANLGRYPGPIHCF